MQRVMGHERASTTLDLYTRRTDDPARILRALGGDDPDDGPSGRSGARLMPFDASLRVTTANSLAGSPPHGASDQAVCLSG
jgi:hypothetical protein